MSLVNDEQTRARYVSMFNTCAVVPEKQSSVDWCVNKLIPLKDKYISIAAQIGCPWWVVGLIHGMESSFKICWLANGDSLDAATVHVPAGLTVPGKKPPYDFIDAAVVSLKHEGWDKKKDWSLGSILIELEKYNGSGYANRGLNSPYLWSFTNKAQKGRYVADGQFDPNSWSNQTGCCAMLKELVKRGVVSLGAIPQPEPKPEPTPYVPLKIGAKGDAVKSLQLALTAHGFPCGSIDGDFGPKTQAALKLCQHCLHHQFYTGVKVTGEYDAITKEVLINYPYGSIKMIEYKDKEPEPIVHTPAQPTNPQVVSEAYKSLLHTKDVKVDHPMSEDQGKIMYTAMAAFVKDKALFTKTVSGAENPDYGSAQCAITTAAVLEAELTRAGFPDLAKLFCLAERKADHFALTHEVEIMLRRMGWFYYLRKDFVVMKGAIGMMAGRYNFAGCTQHSGHVYSLYEDKYPANDIICDNGGWKHVYGEKTEGFWLPPGVFPAKRV